MYTCPQRVPLSGEVTEWIHEAKLATRTAVGLCYEMDAKLFLGQMSNIGLEGNLDLVDSTVI